MSLKVLQSSNKSVAYNLGNGDGFSVKEVIDTAKQVTGREIPVVIADRRAGDPARLVADARLARKALNWTPVFDSLETIIRHAWEWEEKLVVMKG
ncbi:MAG: hypothetical protein IME94_00170 [Proteobacteria bacterium]|nr:hypothetical protein [Pseudomonadota bacterium]